MSKYFTFSFSVRRVIKMESANGFDLGILRFELFLVDAKFLFKEV